MNAEIFTTGVGASSLGPNGCHNSLLRDIGRLVTGWILRNYIAHVGETPFNHGLSIGERKW